jgi:hypothetical protein
MPKAISRGVQKRLERESIARAQQRWNAILESRKGKEETEEREALKGVRRTAKCHDVCSSFACKLYVQKYMETVNIS